MTASLFDSCWVSCGTALSTQTTLALDGPFFDLWVVFVVLWMVLLFVGAFDLSINVEAKDKTVSFHRCTGLIGGGGGDHFLSKGIQSKIQ